MKTRLKLVIVSMLISIAKLLIPPKETDGQLAFDFYLIEESQLPIVKVDIGETKQSFNLVIDINAEHTWISSGLFKCRLSSSCNKHEYIESSMRNDKYAGYRAKDDFIIDTIPIKAFDFFLVDIYNKSLPVQGALSLRREPQRSKSSAVYRIKGSKSVEKPMFALSFNDIHRGNITIRNGYDDDTKLNEAKNRMYNCSLAGIDSIHKWGCILTHVFLGDYGLIEKFDDKSKEPYYEIDANNSISIDKVAYFETIYNKIYVDKDFMVYLKQNYLAQTACAFNEIDKAIKVSCPKGDVVRLHQLNFVFDSHLDLYLSYKELFDCNFPTGRCLFLIEYDENINRDNTTWAIGLPLLKTFTTLFAQDDGIYFNGNNREQVRLINNKDKGSMSSNRTTSNIKLLSYFIGGILTTITIGIALIYALRYKNKGKRDKVTEMTLKFN